MIHVCVHFILLVTAALISFTSQAATPSQSYKFAINSPGSKPYLYFNSSSKTYQGVLADLFEELYAQAGIKIIYLDSSRARSEKLVREGIADMFMLGKVWLDKPDSFLLSKTFMPHASYIYATSPINKPFLPAEHTGATVCTRYGFIYPVLQPFFNKRHLGLLRMNSASQTTMTTMLEKGRCQYAIMSEQNAQSIMYQKKFCSTAFYQSPNVISSVALVLVINPKHKTLEEQINKLIDRQTENGQLAASINYHSGQHLFPKSVCKPSSTQE